MSRFWAYCAVLMIALPGCLGNEDSDVFYGEDINPPVPVSDFLLIDQNGEYFSFSQYEGKVVVIAFLFTRCPDICPIVSANLDYLQMLLGEEYGETVEILSITVDPWTDNHTILADYSEQRGLEWPHLTGNLSDLEEVWLEFDVGLTAYDTDTDGDGVADGFDTCVETPEGEQVDDHGCGLETQQGDDGDVSVKHVGSHEYWVDHTTGTIIVDKQMNQRVWWGDMDWNVELALEDVMLLIDE